MSRRGRRPAGSPDAREAILAAARAAFARDGYNTSLRGVARQARVDPALVHHYFPERSGLFVESVLGAPLIHNYSPVGIGFSHQHFID